MWVAGILPKTRQNKQLFFSCVFRKTPFAKKSTATKKKKYFPIQFVCMIMPLATKEKSWDCAKVTAAAPGPVRGYICSLNRTVVPSLPSHLSEGHPSNTQLANEHQAGRTFSNDSKSESVRLNIVAIFPVVLLQLRQHNPSFVGTALPSVKLISTTPQKLALIWNP